MYVHPCFADHLCGKLGGNAHVACASLAMHTLLTQLHLTQWGQRERTDMHHDIQPDGLLPESAGSFNIGSNNTYM
jgi:hypothetical protein